MTGTGKVCAAGITDVGRRQKTNEDAIGVLPDAGFFCIADGLGVGLNGDVASKAVVDALEAEVQQGGDAWRGLGLAARVACVRTAVDRVDASIRQEARKRDVGEMCSTLVALVLDPRVPGEGMAIHVGDSRLYRFRNGNLECFTVDHTYGAELTGGNCEVPLAANHELTRGIGLCEHAALETNEISLQTGDRVVLCSAGLTHMLPDKALRRILRREAGAGVQALAQVLVDEANAAGGEDNISVVVVDPGWVPVEEVVASGANRHHAARIDWSGNERLGKRVMIAVCLLAVVVVTLLVHAVPFFDQHSKSRTMAAIGPRQAWSPRPVAKTEPAARVALLPELLRDSGAPGIALATGVTSCVATEPIPAPVTTPVEAPIPAPAPLAVGASSGSGSTVSEAPVSDPRQAAVERALETGRWDSPRQLATWAAREEQVVARLGDLNRRIPALLAALGGRSSITNVAEVVGAFAEHQRRIAQVRQWAEDQIAAGRNIEPDVYPRKDIRIAVAAGDLAWQELYLMIESLDEAAASARATADQSLRPWIDRILVIRETILADRKKYPDVSKWWQQGNVALVATLLAGVEEWVNLPGAGLDPSSGQ